MSMKVSLFSTGFSSWPLERCFAAAARCGYDGIDIGGFRPHAYAPDILGGVNGGSKAILDMVQKYQMPIVSYVPENTGSPHSFVYREKELNEISMKYFLSTIDAAKAIEAPMVMFAINMPGFGMDREALKSQVVEDLKVLADHAASLEETVILEPVTPFEGRLCCTSDDVKYYLDQVDNEALKVVLDLACPLTCGEPMSEYWEKMPGAVKEMHFIDAEPDCEDHLIPGDGAMDWPRIVSYLKQVNYDGYLALELFSRYGNEPDFSAERGIEVIRGLLEAE
ncbi:TIM barrel protein [Olegusella massiliensis]|uniref:TIM barrel protein n=1 Tax=Olegusella massiliensis TaxID=1776381 RepID=UPI000837E584|nr:TIM barrel protein [Olegusella massiliensis]